MDATLTNPATGRLSVQTVERLHRLFGGDARVEEMILRFIAEKYGAATLLHLPPQVAKEILKRPADFIQAAKKILEQNNIVELDRLGRIEPPPVVERVRGIGQHRRTAKFLRHFIPGFRELCRQPMSGLVWDLPDIGMTGER